MALRQAIEAHCLRKLGRKPNLDSPTGYNDLIQWLKLYDQRPEHITCCDKWAVRDWVAERAGPEVLVPASLDWPPRKFPVIAKCTHDSGSARLLHGNADFHRWKGYLDSRLQTPYGIEKGEWAYSLVQPRMIVEGLLDDPIVDFKFHCSHGTVKWVQVIWNRHTARTREAICTPHGEPTDLHMDQHMVHDKKLPKPREAILTPDGFVTELHLSHKTKHAPKQLLGLKKGAWESLTDLALRLADGWRYVRVDLYWQGRPLFGELTFWPLAGCYKTKDEPTFGAMLDLDLSYRFDPIVA